MAVFTVPLEKPSAVLSPIIDPAAEISANTSDSPNYFIKVLRYQAVYTVPVQETTGDGDGGPSFDFSLWPYATLVLDGLMVSANAIGLDRIYSDSATVGNRTFAVRLKLGAVRELNFTEMVMERIQVTGSRSAVANRVILSMKQTSFDTASATDVLEDSYP